MTENTIVQMTQDELKEMFKSVVDETVERKLLEILGAGRGLGSQK